MEIKANYELFSPQIRIMYTALQESELLSQSKKFIQSNILKSSDIDLIKDCIRYHEWKYYIQNNAIITDSEYDVLYNLLKQIEEQNPNLVSSDSPTQRVSSDISSTSASVEHMSPMLSLDNTYNIEDLIDFDKRIKKLTNMSEDEILEYLVEP